MSKIQHFEIPVSDLKNPLNSMKQPSVGSLQNSWTITI